MILLLFLDGILHFQSYNALLHGLDQRLPLECLLHSLLVPGHCFLEVLFGFGWSSLPRNSWLILWIFIIIHWLRLICLLASKAAISMDPQGFVGKIALATIFASMWWNSLLCKVYLIFRVLSSFVVVQCLLFRESHRTNVANNGQVIIIHFCFIRYIWHFDLVLQSHVSV